MKWEQGLWLNDNLSEGMDKAVAGPDSIVLPARLQPVREWQPKQWIRETNQVSLLQNAS